MADTTNRVIGTLTNVLNFMSPYAGGSIPSEDDTEYSDWLRWIKLKYEECCVRGFWRRLLTKADQTVTADADYDYLPSNFHKVNGIYMFEVDSVDWSEPDNTDEMTLFVEMDLDTTSDNYGNWRVRYSTAPSEDATATLWYFALPPIPTSGSDKILLPGDLIGYGALIEYFRASGEEGSQDDVRMEFENRFNEYLAIEQLPSKQELASFSTYKGARFDRTAEARDLYTARTNRYRR
jgi:hypothetical protein